MRRLSLTGKKVRGIPRRMRALKNWSDSFANWFPQNLDRNRKYFNWKIPVLDTLIEGYGAKQSVRVECAQRLIDACEHLIQAKPLSARYFRVTCVICLPDMFTSEVCIYLDEEYFKSHTSELDDKYQTRQILTRRNLSQEWGLSIPENMQELGLSIKYHDENYLSEQWYFGELGSKNLKKKTQYIASLLIAMILN